MWTPAPAASMRFLPNLCMPLKIFAALSKLLLVFLLSTVNVVRLLVGVCMCEGGGGRVVICGKTGGKIETLLDCNTNWRGSRY